MVTPTAPNHYKSRNTSQSIDSSKPVKINTFHFINGDPTSIRCKNSYLI